MSSIDGQTPAALAAKNATGTVPIVAVSLTHPVELGLVGSLARSGGNVTGLSYSIGADSMRIGRWQKRLGSCRTKLRR